MNHGKRIAALLLAALLLCTALSGCQPADDGVFSYSDHLDKNGLWQGVKAKKLVEDFEYQALPIPSDVHTITDEELQAEVDALLSEYAAEVEVYDRAARDGDTVNIDYVGSVGGVEFENGSTEGLGTEVIIGYTGYIDDFLEQIIGHMPGETFDVNVTFPEDYGEDHLNGQDAVFVTTLHYIVETAESELTDEFVADTLYADTGWTSVDVMLGDMREDMEEKAIADYIDDYITNRVSVSSLPEKMIVYQENAMIDYYEYAAGNYSMELLDFLTYNFGVSSVEELLEQTKETNTGMARYSLVMQYVAVEQGFTAGEAELKQYLGEDYADYEEYYGLPYLKQFTLSEMAFDYIREHAVLS